MNRKKLCEQLVHELFEMVFQVQWYAERPNPKIKTKLIRRWFSIGKGLAKLHTNTN
jgi:hypothetical protein